MPDRVDTGPFHAVIAGDVEELRGALSRALDRLDLGLILYGDNKVLYANRAVERLIGYTPEEIAAGDVFEWISPRDRELARQRHDARAAGDNTIPLRYVLQVEHRSGELIDLELSLAQFDHRGQTYMMVLLRDVTAAKSVEDRVRHSQKMAAIGKLAQGIAHDFTTYLTAIRLTTEALALNVTDPESRKLLAELEQVTAGASRLTRQLVTFGGQGATKFSVLDVNVVVFEVLNMVQRLLGEEFEISPDLEPGLPPVRADEGQLQQVVVNLVLNAGDAMPEGGKVTIRTRVDGETDRVIISVSDEGEGIPAEVAERVFEPFFGTKGPHSSGMGLAIVYGIVQQGGGEVWFDSKKGDGTTVHVALPAATPPFPPIRHRSTPPEVTDSAPRVLLVEDEPFVRRLLVEGLQRQGFVVCAASDGLEAIRKMDEFAADALVTDMVMPGADGDEVAAAFRERYPDAAVLFISGYPKSQDGGDLPVKGSFLHKPFTARELADALRRELAASG